MILITMYFGEGAFKKGLLVNFDEIHGKIKKFLHDKLKIIKNDSINLIMVDDDAEVTIFEENKVLVTAFLPSELDFNLVASQINNSLSEYIKEEVEVNISCIEIVKNNIYNKLIIEKKEQN